MVILRWLQLFLRQSKGIEDDDEGATFVYDRRHDGVDDALRG